MMQLHDVQRMLPGSVLVGDGSTRIARVHTDTRTLRAGDLFLALKGERFDGHTFLSQAGRSGAVAAVAESGLAEAGLPGVLVADTHAALAELGAAWRAQFALPLIAVTGSNGKTTVTQMIASILRAWQGDGAFSTLGNFNNDIGVPLTLLRLRASHAAAVVELGMNHPGEIAHLARLAQPTVALVNNAQREHQEFMGTVEAVARENGAVIAALRDDGVAVYPSDDRYAGIWRDLAGARRSMTFSLEGAADVTAQARWNVDGWAVRLITPAGEADTTVRVAGRHNVGNALAATACALAAGCPLTAITAGLAAFEPVKGRSMVRRIERPGEAITLVDDTYNANPDSVRAAIDVLAALPSPRWLVLGDMGEVGDQGPAFHAEVGAYAAARGIDSVWLAGALCTHAQAACPGARHFADGAAVVAALGDAPAARSILVKGSRFMKMEHVVEALLAAPASRAAAEGGTHAA